MWNTYLDWARLLREGYSRGLEVGGVFEGIEAVVVCGMGGSGIVGDYTRVIAEHSGGVPVHVVKHYRLPSWAKGEEVLVAAVSFSGNTAETLACYREAARRNCRLLAIASGGKLGEEAAKDGAMVISVPRGPAARTMFPSLLGPLLGALRASGLIHSLVDGMVDEAVRLLSDTRPIVDHARGLASILASAGLTVIIAPPSVEPLAWRVKDELNENAKMLAMVDPVPEMGHNGVEAWLEHRRDTVVLGIDPRIEPDTSLLRGILDILNEAGAKTSSLILDGSSLLAKLLWGSLIAGLTSMEIARLRGVDPSTTPLIKKFRKTTNEALGQSI